MKNLSYLELRGANEKKEKVAEIAAFPFVSFAMFYLHSKRTRIYFYVNEQN